MPPADKNVHPLKHLIAGGTAGAFEISIMYPTEFVKTQLQLSKGGADAPFKGTLDCASYFVKNKGVASLYKGMSSLLIGTIPKTSLRFAAFGQFSNMLRDESGKMTPLRTLGAGMATGLTEALLVVTPVETMKTKLIHDQNTANPRFRGLFHGLSVIAREEGLSGIYKGVTPTIAKQMGNQGIRFTVYGQIKKLMGEGTGQTVHPLVKFAGGGAAGFVSVMFTMPFDVVKTRMQGIDARQYKGTADCVRRILTEEGVLAMWKGTAARLPRVVLGQSITLPGYDFVLSLLNDMW
jgi:solute carrier family 25 citrate transporter 1